MTNPHGPEGVAERLTKAQRAAILAFHPTLPNMWAFDRPRPTYAILCQLRRRGLTECFKRNGGYRGLFGWQWLLTRQGEDVRALLARTPADRGEKEL
jgi:hypothetical protein